MKIISWNVNSIRVRLDHFLCVTKKYSPDIFLLQETRVDDHAFPREYLDDIGYNIEIFGQKGRNGVAIFSKYPLEEVKTDFCEEARYIEALTGGIFVASIYVPNGQSLDSEQYYYKLDFIKDLKERFLQFKNEIFVAGGDYNVAPYKNDALNESAYAGIACSPPERDAIREIRDAGFYDVLADKGFTWWDYRAKSFSRNIGMRLDHFYLSPKANEIFGGGAVLKDIRALEKPSDHAPIICEINL
jgi:exodeoxyribonuclease-3